MTPRTSIDMTVYWMSWGMSWGKAWATLIAIGLGMSLPHLLTADVVWIRENPKPIYGTIVEKNESELKIRIFENGKFQDIASYDIDSIEQTIVNHDATRLALLDPSNLLPYRDYAEELTSQTNDRSAIHLARRLFLITAAHSNNHPGGNEIQSNKIQSNTLRQSALLGLIAIAESELERKRLRILLFLSDPDSPLSGLNLQPAKRPDRPSDIDQRIILELVRSIRMESPSVTKSLMEQNNIQQSLNRWGPGLSFEEVKRMAAANQPSQADLGKLLALELEIVTHLESPQRVPIRRQIWGDFATQASSRLGTLPTFENVTPFSPWRTRFRNGVWVESN